MGRYSQRLVKTYSVIDKKFQPQNDPTRDLNRIRELVNSVKDITDPELKDLLFKANVWAFVAKKNQSNITNNGMIKTNRKFYKYLLLVGKKFKDTKLSDNEFELYVMSILSELNRKSLIGLSVYSAHLDNAGKKAKIYKEIWEALAEDTTLKIVPKIEDIDPSTEDIVLPPHANLIESMLSQMVSYYYMGNWMTPYYKKIMHTLIQNPTNWVVEDSAATLGSTMSMLEANGMLKYLIGVNEHAISVLENVDKYVRKVSTEDSRNGSLFASVRLRPVITKRLNEFTTAFNQFTKYTINNGVLDTGSTHANFLKKLQDSLGKIEYMKYNVRNIMPYLASICHLNESEIRLLYGANTINDIRIPALALARLYFGISNQSGSVAEPIVDELHFNYPIEYRHVSDSPEYMKAFLNFKYAIAIVFENYFWSVRQAVIEKVEKDRKEKFELVFKEFSNNNRSSFVRTLQTNLTSSLKDIIPEEKRRTFQITWGDFDKLINANKYIFLSRDLNILANELTELVKKSFTNAGGGKTIVSDIQGRTNMSDSEKAALLSRVTEQIKETIAELLLTNQYTKGFFEEEVQDVPPAKDETALIARALSDTNLGGLSESVTMREARMGIVGVDARGISVNGVSGEHMDLGIPLFVKINGDISSAKTTDTVTGAVAYRLGNTVLGVIQGYANSGDGFTGDSRQLETSVMASQNFGAFFIEGQLGTVSANQVHMSDWTGMRGQVTLGVDTQFVSPFVQVTHHQLDRNEMFSVNESAAYVGVDMDIASLKADSYTLKTRLLTKVGYGSQSWSEGSKFLGTTSGVTGSVEWSSTLNLNSGISFSTHLNLGTDTKISTGINVSLEQ